MTTFDTMKTENEIIIFDTTESPILQMVKVRAEKTPCKVCKNFGTLELRRAKVCAYCGYKLTQDR